MTSRMCPKRLTRQVIVHRALGGAVLANSMQLVQLESLALYLDTNTTSLGHLPHSEFVKKSVEYVRKSYALASDIARIYPT